MNDSVRTNNQTSSPLLANNPNQADSSMVNSEGSKPTTTRYFHYPLPPALAPHRELPWKDGGVNVSDPTNNAATKKARMIPGSTIARMLSDTTGLVQYAYRDAINTIARDQTLIQPLLVAMGSGDEHAVTAALNSLVTRINSHGFGSSSREWATALFKWMDYIDYGGTDPVPMPFSPFVEAYYHAINSRGWTFDQELSNRFITRDGERGVLPTTPVISATNRVYRDRKGGVVSLRATTAKNPDLRKVEFIGAAGFAATATQILGKGSRSIWGPLSPDSGWGDARFGMLHVSRNIVPGQMPEVSLVGFDSGIARDLAQSALDSFEIQHSPLAARASDAGAFDVDIIETSILRAMSVEDVSATFSQFSELWTDEFTDLGMKRIESLGISPTNN